MTRKTRFALLASGILLGSAVLRAHTPALARTVHLAPHIPSTVVSGTLEGESIVPFNVTLKEGQKLDVQCHSRKSGIYFFVKDPSGRIVYNSAESPQPDRWTGQATSPGKYTLGVFQQHTSARKGHTAFFRLHLAINQTEASHQAEASTASLIP